MKANRTDLKDKCATGWRVCCLLLIVLTTTCSLAVAQDASLRSLQSFLSESGYKPGPIDGLFGQRTHRALEAFQKDHGLTVTGQADEATYRKLQQLQNEQNAPPVQIKEKIPSEAPKSQNSRTIDPKSLSQSKTAGTSGSTPKPDIKATLGPEKPKQIFVAPVSTKSGTPVSAIKEPAPVPLKPATINETVKSEKTKSNGGNALLGIAILAGCVIAIFWVLRWLFRSLQKLGAVLLNKRVSTHIRPSVEPKSGRPQNVWLEKAIATELKGLSFEVQTSVSRIADNSRSGSHGVAIAKTIARNDAKTKSHHRNAFEASPPVSSVSPAPSFSDSPKKTGWIPKSANPTIAGRNIGGMVYVGPAPSIGRYGEKWKPYIDPSLSVARSGSDRDGHFMPYWPSYSEIPAVARATYLDWLASGRSNASYDPGYMFLYFYGLEQRFFVDKPDDSEKIEIIEEVKRLKKLYQDNHSSQKYLGRFIELAQLVLSPSQIELPEEPTWNSELPERIKIHIGRKLNENQTLDSNDSFVWFRHHPERRLRTPARRCQSEFLTLFDIYFQARFPSGMKINKPHKKLRIEYHSASSDFSADLTHIIGDLPDISGLSKPVSDLQEIADEAMDALDKFSRFLGPDEIGRGTIRSHALLPVELRSQVSCSELDELQSWASSILENGGRVAAMALIEKLEGEVPSKLSKRSLIDSANALEMVGVGLAPDPRFALRSPAIEDPVILFRLPENMPPMHDTSEQYQETLLKVALGAVVAQADGEIAESEINALKQTIQETPNLSSAERLRLAANLSWFFSITPNLQQLRGRLKNVDNDAKQAIAQIAVTIAGADGIIHREEVGQIEKLYKVLGLSSEELYSHLHDSALNTDDLDDPIIVRGAVPPEKGLSIPLDIDVTGGPQMHVLDQSKLNEIRTDTKKVSQLLSSIFSEEDDETEDDFADNPNEASTQKIFKGLDARHSDLLRELIQREEWARHELDTLAKRFGLLAEGCLETINEWAFDSFGDMLIEEDEVFELNNEVIGLLMESRA